MTFFTSLYMPQVNETIKKKKNILVWHKIQEEKSNGYDKKADVVMRQAIMFFFFFLRNWQAIMW